MISDDDGSGCMFVGLLEGIFGASRWDAIVGSVLGGEVWKFISTFIVIHNHTRTGIIIIVINIIV